MSGIWGKNIKLSIFGESHGKSVGIVIDGLPPGLNLDFDAINKELARRAPGRSHLSTARQEKDTFEILSGYFNNKTTGTPLCSIIRNTDHRSKDYEKIKNVMRPGHGDYTGYIKYKGFNDYRGGGHFSGRLTAPLVFAGAIAKQILEKKQILIGSHIHSILNICDNTFKGVHIEESELKELLQMDFPVLDDNKGLEMKRVIMQAKEQLDSVGGVVETAIIHIPAGLGAPFFDSVESRLAHMLFSIPAVKGIEFGSGFDMAKMKGSEAKDEYIIQENKIKTLANHNGGIVGGITTGMPIVFRTAFKPTPSIPQQQKTIDIEKMEKVDLEITGRHDPCIVPRAIPVVEAAAALVVLDLMIEKDGVSWMS